VVSAKRRSETTYRTLTAKLKLSGAYVKIAAVGYLNANGVEAGGQNLIFDNLQLTTFPSVGNSSSTSIVNADLSGLNQGAEYNYRVVAYGLSGAGYGATASGVAGQSLGGIAAWRQKWFDNPENAGAGADLNDYAGDGVKNLVKYALGLDPGQPAQNGGVAFSEGVGGALSVTFNRRKDASDVTYRVEASSDLRSGWTEIWSSATNSYPGGTNDVFSQTVTDVMPAESSPSGLRFIRFNVSRP
jgi:hypothetical protein